MIRLTAIFVSVGLTTGCQALVGWSSLPVGPTAEPAFEQGSRRPTLVQVPAAEPPPSEPPPTYRYLTAEQCRRRALEVAPLARLLTATAPRPSHPLLHRSAASTHLECLIRAYAADELRNRHIAETLSDYYRLAALEAQYDIWRQAEHILQEQIQIQQRAVEQGVSTPQEMQALQRQLLEVRAQLAQLAAARVALNAALVQRLDLSEADPPLWPDVTLHLDPRDLDAPAALATADLYRPDLNILRLLARADLRLIPTAQALLQSIHPLLGTQTQPSPLAFLLAELRKAPTGDEKRWQMHLAAVLEARQRQVAGEVRTAIALRQGRRILVQARQAQAEHWRQQRDELEKRQAAGQAVTRELLTARLELLRAQAAVIEAVADWYLADIQLRQALGLLVRE
jgi:hypothetical protein